MKVLKAKRQSKSAGHRLKFPFNMMFGALTDRRYRFKQPLTVRVSREEDGTYVVHCQALEQFGYGSNLSEALDDFSKTIIEMFEYLRVEAERSALASSLQNPYSVLAETLEVRKSSDRAA